MKACPFCAEQIQDAASKCRFCGERVDGARVNPRSPVREDGPSAGRIAGGTAMGIVGALLILAALPVLAVIVLILLVAVGVPLAQVPESVWVSVLLVVVAVGAFVVVRLERRRKSGPR